MLNLTLKEYLLKKSKKNYESVTLLLIFHKQLSFVHEILRQAHRHILKSNRLLKVLQSPPRVAFRN